MRQADLIQGDWLFLEGLTRTNIGLRPIMITFTPLLGMSNVVRRYVIDKLLGTHVTQMTLEDAEHYTSVERSAIASSYPLFERDARTKGVPMRVSGAVFPLDIGQILCASFPISEHWVQICGIDLGWAHPSAGVRLAWDRDTYVIYVIAEHRAKEQTPIMFAGSVKPWGAWLPWVWRSRSAAGIGARRTPKAEIAAVRGF